MFASEFFSLVVLKIHQFCQLPFYTSGRACSDRTVVEFPVAATCSALIQAGEFSAEGTVPTIYCFLEIHSFEVIKVA